MSSVYEIYLQSDDWKSKRLCAIAKYCGRCTRCGRSVKNPVQNMQVHHEEYATDLRLVPADKLKPLCFKCHGKIHIESTEFIATWGVANAATERSFHRLTVDFNLLSRVEKDKVVIYLKNLSYESFHLTPYWKAISLHVKILAQWSCATCQANQPGTHFEIRHKSYANHGNEIQHLEDLECLCGPCHQIIL